MPDNVYIARNQWSAGSLQVTECRNLWIEDTALYGGWIDIGPNPTVTRLTIRRNRLAGGILNLHGRLVGPYDLAHDALVVRNP